jgi:hypothetical protein
MKLKLHKISVYILRGIFLILFILTFAMLYSALFPFTKFNFINHGESPIFRAIIGLITSVIFLPILEELVFRYWLINTKRIHFRITCFVMFLIFVSNQLMYLLPGDIPSLDNLLYFWTQDNPMFQNKLFYWVFIGTKLKYVFIFPIVYSFIRLFRLPSLRASNFLDNKYISKLSYLAVYYFFITHHSINMSYQTQAGFIFYVLISAVFLLVVNKMGVKNSILFHIMMNANVNAFQLDIFQYSDLIPIFVIEILLRVIILTYLIHQAFTILSTKDDKGDFVNLEVV